LKIFIAANERQNTVETLGYVTIDDNETNAVSFISNKKYIEKRYSPT